MAIFGGKKSEGDTGEAAVVPPSAPRAPASTEAPRAPRAPVQGENAVANIGKSISIKGDLSGNEDMAIEGTVEGKIDLLNNQLTIGANGSVNAEVHAKSVIIIGHVIGNVSGIERVEIQATGRVEGNVSAPKLIVAEGARIDGSIQMAGTESSATPRTTPAAVKSEEVRKAG